MTKRIVITPRASQVFYLSFDDYIEVVRILHAARDLEEVLSGDEAD